MKIMRKYKITALVALFLAAILALSACAPAGANKNAASANGTWGENVTWEYDSGTKTLTISGKGNMKAMTTADDIPWAKANMSAETLVVEEGILSVCDYAFYGFGALKTVVLPEGLTSIGNLSFAFCGALETLSLPSTLVEIGDSAFEWCASLKSVNVGSNLKDLGSRAFAYCRALSSAYLCSEGLEIEAETFRGAAALTTLVLHPSITEDKVSELAFDSNFDYSKASFDETANDQVTITVNYVDNGGAKMAEPKTVTLKLGEAYSIETPYIEGYTASVASVEGVAGTSDETVDVIYTLTPIETESETESETETPEKDEDKSPKVLPIIILVVVLAAIGVGAYFLVKSNKKEAERQANQNKAKNRKQK